MQSSAVVTLRVAVMLTCLIVAPMAAIFGSSLPKVVSSVLQGKGFPRTGHEATANELRAQGGEAPVFGASVRVPGREDPSAGERGREGAAPLWPAGVADGAIAAAPQNQNQAQPQSQAIAPAARQPGRQEAAAPRAAPAGAPGAPAPVGNGSPGGEPSQLIERRLRELGATYYLLEYLGNSAQNYRFHCKMSIAGSPNLTRRFEATENDPVQAMRQVLDQVEKWRAGAQP